MSTDQLLLLLAFCFILFDFIFVKALTKVPNKFSTI